MTKTIPSKLAVIITAAGSSTRIGGGIKKEYLPYKNGTVLSACASVFFKADYKKLNLDLACLVVTYPEGGLEKCREALCSDEELKSAAFQSKLIFAKGRESRQASVFSGLQAAKESCPDLDYVLIHDGARPFLSSSLVLELADAAQRYGAAVPGLTPIDTQKEINKDGFIERHLVRQNLVAVQTPQGFKFTPLFEAHLKAEELAKKSHREFTDDTEIWGEFCGAVKVIPGSPENIKITYPSDLEKL